MASSIINLYWHTYLSLWIADNVILIFYNSVAILHIAIKNVKLLVPHVCLEWELSCARASWSQPQTFSGFSLTVYNNKELEYLAPWKHQDKQAEIWAMMTVYHICQLTLPIWSLRTWISWMLTTGTVIVRWEQNYTDLEHHCKATLTYKNP